MDTNKIGVAEWLDKYEFECSDKHAVAWLYEDVLEFLDKNNKDNFDVYFLPVHPLE